MLLFSGGLRIGEVVKVNLQDVRSTGIFVHSEKGGEDGVVGLSHDCISSIQKYMMYRRETDPSALFTSSSVLFFATFLVIFISLMNLTR